MFFSRSEFVFALLNGREAFGLNNRSAEFGFGDNLCRLLLRREQFLFGIKLDRTALCETDENAQYIAEHDAAYAREREHDQYDLE